MTDLVPVKRALISLSDKSELDRLAAALTGLGVEIVSTGGTAGKLRELGANVRDVSDLTGFPEMMDGRVKTLHPKVHGGLLAVRDNPDHSSAMAEHGIAAIDLVVVNLYPFEATLARCGSRTDFADPVVVAGAAHLPHVEAQLAAAPDAQIIVEPAARSTAAAIALAALRLPDDAVMLVCPSDHHIAEEEAFSAAARAAAALAEQGWLVSFGIAATAPETVIAQGVLTPKRRAGNAIEYGAANCIEKSDSG